MTVLHTPIPKDSFDKCRSGLQMLFQAKKIKTVSLRWDKQSSEDENLCSLRNGMYFTIWLIVVDFFYRY